MSKRICWDCKTKIAEWVYMPGYQGKKQEENYFCDDCISSIDDEGCSCNWFHESDNPTNNSAFIYQEIPQGIEGKNWKWVNKEDKSFQYLDNKGRPYPCCEYEHDSDGFDIEVEETFFEKLKMIDTDDKWLTSLDYMNHYFNNVLNTADYDFCNFLINCFFNSNYNFSIRLHLGLLTITNRRKIHLNKKGGDRERLYKKTEELLLKVMSVEQTENSLRNLK